MIAGQSGYGKSATVKQLFSRQVDFGVHIANIDYEPLPGDGKRGEYSIVAEAVGGVNYLISNYSDSQLNFLRSAMSMNITGQPERRYQRCIWKKRLWT